MLTHPFATSGRIDPKAAWKLVRGLGFATTGAADAGSNTCLTRAFAAAQLVPKEERTSVAWSMSRNYQETDAVEYEASRDRLADRCLNGAEQCGLEAKVLLCGQSVLS